MKTLLLFMLCLPSFLFAQDSLKTKIKKNEISINTFELVIARIIPITYERFIDSNQSITVKTFLFDKRYTEFNSNNIYISLQAQYNFYFSEKKKNAGFSFSPFFKFTKGKYHYGESSGYYDNNGIYQVRLKKAILDVNGAILGLGLGYKLLWKEKISLNFTTDVGRVVHAKGYYAEYIPIELRIGMNMGLRF
ncbi:hypothetical protein [Emticicia sp. W12TSBA100-4]|uniref:hypothetical protein n=1 Tax=Emticicia sp. W12TSBA100-4 TaxID=3160965 RepID=UPI0033057B66